MFLIYENDKRKRVSRRCKFTKEDKKLRGLQGFADKQEIWMEKNKDN